MGLSERFRLPVIPVPPIYITTVLVSSEDT